MGRVNRLIVYLHAAQLMLQMLNICHLHVLTIELFILRKRKKEESLLKHTRCIQVCASFHHEVLVEFGIEVQQK